MLDDLGNLDNRETPVVSWILVIEDLVMAFYLPLMAGLLIGGSLFEIDLESFIAVSAVVVALVIAVRSDTGSALHDAGRRSRRGGGARAHHGTLDTDP